MEKRTKKPGVPKKAGKVRSTAKKKRRKKPGAKDKVYAVLAAASVILAGAIVSLIMLFFGSPPDEAVSQTAPEPIIIQSAPEKQPDNSVPEQPAAGRPSAGQSIAAQPSATQPSTAQPITTQPSATPSAALPIAAQPAATQTSPGTAVETRVASKGALVFVIDDAGNNLRELDPFLKFPGALTIAVLPALPNSAEAARRIREAGKEVILHQPMESIRGTNPGPGAIMAGMGRDEVRAIINRNLNEVWPVSGMNNHEGSRITMDDEIMEVILELCRERGIYFLDSRTTADTAAPRIARQLGITIGERDIFVDNEQDRESMIGYINAGLLRAEQRGSAIFIGHTWSPALAPLLTELFPVLSRQGFSFSPASNVIGREGS